MAQFDDKTTLAKRLDDIANSKKINVENKTSYADKAISAAIDNLTFDIRKTDPNERNFTVATPETFKEIETKIHEIQSAINNTFPETRSNKNEGTGTMCKYYVMVNTYFFRLFEYSTNTTTKIDIPPSSLFKLVSPNCTKENDFHEFQEKVSYNEVLKNSLTSETLIDIRVDLDAFYPPGKATDGADTLLIQHYYNAVNQYINNITETALTNINIADFDLDTSEEQNLRTYWLQFLLATIRKETQNVQNITAKSKQEDVDALLENETTTHLWADIQKVKGWGIDTRSAEKIFEMLKTEYSKMHQRRLTSITQKTEKGKIREMQDENAKLQEENRTLKDQATKEEEKKKALRKKYDGIAADNKKCAEEKERLTNEIEALRNENVELQKSIATLTAEITERQNAPMSEVDPMLRAQEAECAELKKKKEECEAKLAEKEEEQKILETTISDLQSKLSEEQQQVAKQANVIEEDKKMIEKKEKENKKLEEENDKIHEKKIKLERELAAATKTYKATNEEKNKLIIEKNNAQIAALEKQKDLTKKLEDTEADLKNTTKQLENAIAGKKNTGIVLTLEKSIENLKKDIAEHEKTIAETQAELDAKIKENENNEKEWVAKIDAIQNAANDDRADLLKKNLEYNAEFEKRSALERELEKLKTTTTAPSNEREINDLKQALATGEKENATLKEQLEKEKENNVRLETKYDEAYRSKYDEIMRKTKPTLMAEIDQLKAKKDALTTDITKSDNAAVAQLQKKLSDLQVLYEAEVSSYEKEKSKNEECESIKAALRSDIEENKKKSAALQKEIARQNAALDVLQQQFDEKDVFAENNAAVIAEINEKDKELGKLREALARCANEKSAMDARYEQLSSTNATLERENEKNEEYIDRLKKRENDLLNELSTLFRSTTNTPQTLEKERQRELEAIQDNFKTSTPERQNEYSNWHDFVAEHKSTSFIQQPSPGLFHFEIPTSSEDAVLKRHITFREPNDVSIYEPLMSGANGTHYAVVQTQSTFKNYKDFDETHFLACQIKPFAGFDTMETIFSKNNTNLIIKSTVRFTNQPVYNTLFLDHAFPLVFGTPSLAFQLLWSIGYVSTEVESFATTGTNFTGGTNYAFSPTMAYAIDNKALISTGPNASQSSLHCIYLHTVSRPRVINRRRTVSTGVILPQPIQRHPICKITPEFLTKASYTPEEEENIINYSYYMHDWYINFRDTQSSHHS